jgi:8-oxo-dGTP pyrophosphatase MutT (NUDIX family)
VHAFLPVPLRRLGYRCAYLGLRLFWFLARPRVSGVKCLLTERDRVLLVRHTYGPQRRWELPGGGIKRAEEPRAAARRETREELGVDIDDWRPLGDLFERIDGKRDTLWCFSAAVGDREIVTDGAEIAEARWFPRGALPADSHRYVARILAL